MIPINIDHLQFGCKRIKMSVSFKGRKPETLLEVSVLFHIFIFTVNFCSLVYIDSCWTWLGNVVSKMCKDADLQGQFSNHSLRATTATRGLEKGISHKLIMERTGHRDIRLKMFLE